MSGADLVAELERAGIHLWEEGGQLRYRSRRGGMTAEMRRRLNDHRAAVLAELRRVGRTDAVVADPDRRHEPFPLTDVQEAYALGRQPAFDLGGVGCHGYLELAWPGADPERLQRAWRQLVARHDMLRAVVEDGRQRVLRQVPEVRLPVTDLRGRPDEVEPAVQATRARMSHRVYRPGEWPMFDVALTRTDEGDWLHLSLDLLVADLVSLEILLEELEVLHEDPAADLPVPEIAFRDVVLAERQLRDGARYRLDEDWWQARLGTFPPGPELPFADLAAAPPHFTRLDTRLPAERWAQLKARAAANGTTPAGATMAAFAEVVARWSRSRPFGLAVTLLNRPPHLTQTERIVGDFTTVDLLAVDPTAGPTLGDRARALQSQLWADLDHRLFSGIQVARELRRRRAGAARYPVAFTGVAGGGTPERPRPSLLARARYAITQTPQVALDCQVTERGDELAVNWDVRDGTLRPGVAEAMFGAFDRLLGALATSDEPWGRDDAVTLDEAQRRRRAAVNATAGPLPEGLLHDPVWAEVERSPDRIAVIAPASTLTFGELGARAAAVADRLSAAGATSGDIVAVVMDKGPEQVIAVLGALLAGGVYLPVDTSQPSVRRRAIIDDAAARWVLTQSWVAATGELDDLDPVAVDRLDASPRPGARRPRRSPDDLAYVIYTSGSTGAPKGVMVSHRSARNTVDDMLRRFGIGEDDRVLGLASLGFDLSVFDVFGLLAVGGGLVLPMADRRRDPSHWAELVSGHAVTVWNSVPAQLQMLRDYVAATGRHHLASLRLGLLSGDWIPVGLPDQVRSLVPDIDLVSLGGATEAAIWSVMHRIDGVRPDWSSIPYGRPLTNQTCRVVDAAGRDCPDEVVGELLIGGAGLALGYLHDEARTAERFVVLPDGSGRHYRTGDLARYLPSGELELLGREDLQVKIRGHRVELAEVETALAVHEAVRAAVVVVVGDRPLDRRLAAVVEADPVAPGQESLDWEALRAHVGARLPDHMVPSRFVTVDALPLTGNGKVDRHAVLALVAGGDGTGRTGHPDDRADGPGDGLERGLERAVAAVWCDALDVEAVGRDDNFFMLGGDSLIAARIAAELAGRDIAAGHTFDELLVHLLETATVAGFAARLGADRTGQDRSEPAPGGAPGRAPTTVDRLGSPDGPAVHVVVHDGTGTVAAVAGLVTGLAEHGPVHALSVTDPGWYRSLSTTQLFELVAREHLEQLEALGPDPRRRHVLGSGTGALVAVELARQLAEQGSEVGMLTLVDPRPDAGLHQPAGARAALARAFGCDGPHGDLDELLADLTPLLAALPPGTATTHPAATAWELFHHTLGAIAGARPEYAGDVTAVVADGDVDAVVPYLEELCVGRLSVHTVAAAPAALLRPPHLATVIEAIAPRRAPTP